MPSRKSKKMRKMKNRLNTNNNILVHANEGMSKVPYFIPSSSISPEHRPDLYITSMYKRTNWWTITREENFAGGRWCQVPHCLMLPQPPTVWLEEKTRNRLEDEGIEISEEERLQVSHRSLLKTMRNNPEREGNEVADDEGIEVTEDIEVSRDEGIEDSEKGVIVM